MKPDEWVTCRSFVSLSCENECLHLIMVEKLKIFQQRTKK
jgi:hypothetical protein